MQTMYNPQTLNELNEFFQADTEPLLTEKMDARAEEMRPRGYTVVKREKIGRNQLCPCGSGLKFKRCCIHKAR